MPMKPKKPDAKNPKITPMPASMQAAEPPKPIILQPGSPAWKSVMEAARAEGREPEAFCLVAAARAVTEHDQSVMKALNGEKAQPPPHGPTGYNPFACLDPALESKVYEIVGEMGITPSDFARACIHRGLRELKEKGAVTFSAPATPEDSPVTSSEVKAAIDASVGGMSELEALMETEGMTFSEAVRHLGWVYAPTLVAAALGKHAQQEKELETAEAFNRFALGWGPHDPPPTVDDLLEPDLKQKLLDIWLATGTNVIATEAVSIVLDFAESLPVAIQRVRESQESELYSVLVDLSEKWKGGPEA